MFLTSDQAREFAAQWLPAWTGNNPQYLTGFYSEDAFYSDPAIPTGIRGSSALLAYFTRLLSQNPTWVWRQIEGIPMEGGFLNKWHASIPVGDNILEVVGVCLVQLDADCKISSNEVYFDRSELLQAIIKQRGLA